MKENRNIVFDAVKALAIWLVVFAHSIQYIGGVDYTNDMIFQTIYSFHMPLFFVISGFFFLSALRLGWKEFLIKKSTTLLLPCFIWALIYGGIHFTSWRAFGANLINPQVWPFWFLKGLFLVQLIVYTCSRISARIMGGGKIEIAFAILCSMIVYMLPFMSVPRVMIPMFWTGYLMRRYYEPFKANYAIWGVVTTSVFGILLWFWDSQAMQYYSGALPKVYEIVVQMNGYTCHDGIVVLYRIAIGMAGSIAVIAWMHVIKHLPNILAIVGSTTQGIYILQTLVLETILGTYVCLKGMNYYLLMIVVLPISSIAIVVGCAYISKWMKEKRWMGFLIGDRG